MVSVRLADEAWGTVEAEALVDKWLAAEGDRVIEGQPLVSVVLVKTTIEIPTPVSGTLTRILVQPEGTFKRGQDLALIEEAAT